MNIITKKSINNNLLTISRLLQDPSVVSSDSNNRKIIYLNNGKNKSIQNLRELLTDLGCFEFYSTNTGKRVIGLSQIIYFIHSGYKAYANGYKVSQNMHEVHHIDGDVTNNSSKNLLLLSSFDHYLVTAFQQAHIKLLADFNMSCSSSKYDSINSTPFNNQGRKIKNHKHFLCNIIAKTILATSQSQWLERASQRKILIIEVDRLVSKFNPEKYNSFYQEQLLEQTQSSLEKIFKAGVAQVFNNTQNI